MNKTIKKCSILLKVKEDDPALAGLTTDIHTVFRGLKFESDAKIEQKGTFFKGLGMR
jgi:hypothetical protein